MKRNFLTALAFVTGLGAAPAGVAAEARIPRLQFTDQHLENGLRVIIAPDHSAPVFSIAVTYNVGSRNERPGRTGFAHLFEHMMFQGSENVGKGEHFILIFNNGGGMNGTTNEDRTNHFEQLPRNHAGAVLTAAKKYVDLDHLQIVCVGDGKQPGNKEGKPIRDVLKQYGPVEVYDADGKRLE